MTLDMSLPFGTTTACELPKCVLYDGISVLQLTFILIEDEDRSTEDIGVPPLALIYFMQEIWEMLNDCLYVLMALSCAIWLHKHHI